MEKDLGGYKVTFGPGENVTIEGRTLTVWEWLSFPISQKSLTWGIFVEGAKCGGHNALLSSDQYNAIKSALVDHAQGLKGGGEFWIHHKDQSGRNFFDKAIAESWCDFVCKPESETGGFRIKHKSQIWSRVPAPWIEVECKQNGCGHAVKFYNRNGIWEFGGHPDACLSSWRLVDNEVLLHHANGKYYSCKLGERDWHPELVEEKKAKRIPSLYSCSACHMTVGYIIKKTCPHCGAELSDD